jgi:hypothetical protein
VPAAEIEQLNFAAAAVNRQARRKRQVGGSQLDFFFLRNAKLKRRNLPLLHSELPRIGGGCLRLEGIESLLEESRRRLGSIRLLLQHVAQAA